MVEARRVGSKSKKATPPILSHDFIIQNHGDIMSCVLMVFIVGLMFPLTSSVSALFVAPQYNETITANTEYGPVSVTAYRNGLKDICTVFFYTVAWIVMHAVIQEYILDKLQRKVHLSKVKTFKFTESGHQVLFSLYSSIHAVYVLMEFVYTIADFKKIWLGYPDDHRIMTLNTKVFFILQIAYWIHQFPEFYFAKFKKDEMRQRTFISLIYIIFLSAAYTMNFTRVATVLLLLEYSAQTVFHFARLAHFLEKKTVAKTAFKIWNALFLPVRMASAVLTVMTFWYGMRQSESAFIDVANGNFNTSYVRLNCMLAVIFLQLFQLWNFSSFHVARFKESAAKKKTDRKPLVSTTEKKKKPEDSGSESSADKKDKKRN